MREAVVVVRRRVLPVPSDVVWRRATSVAGMRHEMRPLLLMTTPPGLRGKTLAEADDLVGRPLGKAWLFLLGVLPVDFDDMTIVAVGPSSFHERSRMLLLPVWEHRREVRRVDDTRCEVIDRLDFTIRWDLTGLRALARVLVGTFFSHRQRRLATWASGQDMRQSG